MNTALGQGAVLDGHRLTAATAAYQSFLVYRFFREIASQLSLRRFDSGIQCPIHPKLQPIFYEFAKKHSDTVRKFGSEPILFMSWAYADKPDMTEPLAAEYTKAGKLNNALVVPAGYSFANSIAKRPELSLLVADKRHPNMAGTYLAASTVLASVYKINPIGNKYTAGLPADVVKHLQTVAWETSQQFHAKEGRGSMP